MANFYLQIDRPFYFAGDLVTGHLLINVLQPLQSTGISLKFSGYECVKWSSKTEIHRPGFIEGRPPPQGDPLRNIPKEKIMHTDRFDLSDLESEDREGFNFRRPEYILTPKGKLFKMKYSQSRNLFAREKMMVYECDGLMPGQYSFPISFKTFEGWPATFDYNLPTKKGKIKYHLSAQVEPENAGWSMKCGAQILLRESKALSSPIKQSTTEVKSCCCVGKGSSGINAHFEKDGYMPGEVVRIIVEIDNSECQAAIEGLNITIMNTISLRSPNDSCSDSYPVFSKRLPGIAAGQRMLGNDSIKESFPLVSDKRPIKPTCNGKLLSSVYDIILKLNHNVACQCCAGSPQVVQRVLIFPQLFEYNMPNTFTQSSWQPRLMPMIDFALNNLFPNFKIGVMINANENNYPPQPNHHEGYNKLSDDDSRPNKSVNKKAGKKGSKSKGKY